MRAFNREKSCIRLTSVNGRVEQLARFDDGIMALIRRAGMPWNSGCGFNEWCGLYAGIMEKLGIE